MNKEKLFISARFYRVNLQLFAKEGPGGERTETATAKKRQDARKKGQVMKSAEVVTVVDLLAAFFTLRLCGGLIYEQITQFTKLLYNDYALAAGKITAKLMFKLYADAGLAFLLSAGPVPAAVYVAAFTANVAQVGFHFTTEPLKFKPDKINPINGFKRLFSGKNLVNLLKSVVKVVIIGYMAYSFVGGRLSELMALMGADIKMVVRRGLDMIFDLAFRICAAMLVLAILDYAWQWRQYEQDLKMTKQEVKEEYKQMEGDPKIKSKIKEKQRKISMQRMMSSVPQADVVITNPTHYAIAIKYDSAIADAPVVLAKGRDYIALRIKKIAAENGVALVENKPLARALHDTVDVGDKIPIELYHAVAEVLAYVFNTQKRKVV